MLLFSRNATRLSIPIYRQRLFSSTTTRCTSKGRVPPDYSNAELNVAREWLKHVNPETIPQKLCEITFSRSSGPGGQNVNKVSTKATLRLPTSALLPLLPEPIHAAVLASRYHARKSGDIVVQADDSRKQADNVQACYRKLFEMIVDAGKESVPGETSPEQAARVRRLKEAEDAARKKMKMAHSSKKASRRAGGKFDD